MPTYDKVKCEDCGEMVSMHPMSQKKHKNECKGRPMETENKEEVKTVVAKPEVVEAADEATAELYKIAMQALEVRKEAPELFVAGSHTDERKELVARYAPECVDPVYTSVQRSVCQSWLVKVMYQYWTRTSFTFSTRATCL